MGVHIWDASLLKGPKGEHPPKDNSIFFGYFVNKYIDRKSSCKGVSERRKVARGLKDKTM